MNIYLHKDHAVVIAKSQSEAAELLTKRLIQSGNTGVIRYEEMQELSKYERRAIIFALGDIERVKG